MVTARGQGVTGWIRDRTNRPLMLAALLTGLLLTLVSGRYGWERDELYFAMLKPAWGYVDQPPLVPLMAHVLSSVVDAVWFVRIPATLAAMTTVIIVALVCRELGGSDRATAWTAWLTAGTSAVLGFGHVLLTNVFDLATWSLICLLVIRAELRSRPRLWLAAGVVAGLSTYAKWLVVWLLVGILVGLVVAGPRERLRSRPVLVGGVAAVVLSAPNWIYQLTHDLPQLRMGAALSANNAGEVRWFMWVLILVILGPVLVPVWGLGAAGLWRRAQWRNVRFLLPATVFVVLATFAAGAQPTYPTPMLLILLAAGMASRGDRIVGRGWVRVLLVVNAAVALVVSLPLLPVAIVGRTPIPAMNATVADQIGWPAYVSDVEAAVATLDPSERHTTVVLASNYGEAGALTRRGQDLPPIYSGHNSLGEFPPPPETATTVVVVGGQARIASRWFTTCTVVGHLDNRVDVDTEEQGDPIAVCRGLTRPWTVLWPLIEHLD
ncbi:MAG: glycosyltransferase family 39 protein [Nostocoides sp.]